MLTSSMSKSDLSSLKKRLGAQWKMNRLRLVHGLRHSFYHMCVTEGLGTATLCPIDMYDRVQADADCFLTMSKKEVNQLFGRSGRMFCWTQLVRSVPLPRTSPCRFAVPPCTGCLVWRVLTTVSHPRRHLLVYPDYVVLPQPVVPDFPPRPSELLRSIRSTYNGPAFSPGLASSQSLPTLPPLRT